MEITANFLDLACQKAWEYQGLTYPNPAVGALVAKEGRIIAVEAHKKAGAPHAEVEALKSAFFSLSNDSNQKELLSKLQTSHEIHDFLKRNAKKLFEGCDIFVTLEPCSHEGKTPACADLLEALKPQSVTAGTKEQNEKALGGIKRLQEAGINAQTIYNEACDELTEPFFRWNSGKGFTFFKIALTMNGKISGGKISSPSSFLLTHKLRDKIELLAIGGSTVRIDRPTLDARLAGGKAPNVLIYSRQTSFDESIPLFGVLGRNVTVSNSLDEIKKYNFTMVEGGANMLNALKNQIDYYLFFVSAKFSGKSDLEDIDLSFKILHSRKVDTDILIWAKRSDNG